MHIEGPCSLRVRREYAQYVRRLLRARCNSSHSLPKRYELVLGSFEIRFQFGMSSLDDHIRRISSAKMCVLEILSYFAIR